MQPRKMMSGVVLLLALALAGCGSSAVSNTKTSPIIKDPAIPFKSAAITGATLPARYTCDGKNIAPPLEWGAVPSGTRQLAVFLVGYAPDPAKHGYQLGVEWALSGVNPALHRLAAGQLPQGVHIGEASDGERSYSVCPKKGTSEHYRFEIFGLSASAKIPPNFAGLPVLLSLAHSKEASLVNSYGGFATLYARR